jgi:hypothetical protein
VWLRTPPHPAPTSPEARFWTIHEAAVRKCSVADHSESGSNRQAMPLAPAKRVDSVQSLLVMVSFSTSSWT